MRTIMKKNTLVILSAAAIISVAGLLMPFLISNDDTSEGFNTVRTVITIATFFFLYFSTMVDAWKRFHGYRRMLSFLLIFFLPVVGAYCYFIFLMLPAVWKYKNQ